MWVGSSPKARLITAPMFISGSMPSRRLMAALDSAAELRRLPCPIPKAMRRVILAARSVSEAVSGAGESGDTRKVTVNIGNFEGGDGRQHHSRSCKSARGHSHSHPGLSRCPNTAAPSPLNSTVCPALPGGF